MRYLSEKYSESNPLKGNLKQNLRSCGWSSGGKKMKGRSCIAPSSIKRAY